VSHDDTSVISLRWSGAPPALQRPTNSVHVWSIDLHEAALAIDPLASTLSSDERHRAKRFYFDRDRQRFVCARGVLRCLLAGYLDVNPAAIRFTYATHGKPQLVPTRARSLSFNLSHSHDLALIAVAPAHIDVGVDVELIRPVPEMQTIAASFFAPSEAARLDAMPTDVSAAAFFRCWTRKEAYLKAVGEGLSRPLSGFEVTFADEEDAELRVIGDERESARWRVTALQPQFNYAAALVASCGFQRIDCWRWTPASSHVDEHPVSLQVNRRVL
jgi:4'-phosphopantetheinyl transferase